MIFGKKDPELPAFQEKYKHTIARFLEEIGEVKTSLRIILENELKNWNNTKIEWIRRQEFSTFSLTLLGPDSFQKLDNHLAFLEKNITHPKAKEFIQQTRELREKLSSIHRVTIALNKQRKIKTKQNLQDRTEYLKELINLTKGFRFRMINDMTKRHEEEINN